jgi:hypothetical protein
MRLELTPVPAVLVSLTLGLAALAGCGGGDGDETAFTPAPGSDSAYCDTYRAWQVHELDGGEGDDQRTPAAFRRYWNDYLVNEETLLQQAPPEIREEVELKVSAIRTLMTPLFEKYDFDERRMEREGTPAEKALLAGPPPDVQRAQDAQHAYEDRTCGVVPSPPAADVVFKADGSSKAFCTALSAFDGELDKVTASRFDPDVMRRVVTGDGLADVLDRLDAAAPAEIAADVEADTEWFRTRLNDVLATYDYDVRVIYLDATPEDLAVFNRSHPDVVEHAARIRAYDEQVCEA